MPRDDATIPDGYAAVSLHGIWPLVADPDAAAGVRFAVLGQDPEEACLREVGDLPGHEISLRTFTGGRTRLAWVAAAREFGGNGLVVVEGPAFSNGTVSLALVARLDRDRPEGGRTLEDAIPLVRDLEEPHLVGDGPRDLAGLGARERARVLADLSQALGLAAFRTRWAREIEAMGTVPGIKVIHDGSKDGPGIAFYLTARPTEAGLAEPSAGGMDVSLRVRNRVELDPDLAADVTAVAAARGWVLGRDDVMRLSVPALDRDVAARIAADADAVSAAGARAFAARESRRTLLGLTVDAETMRVVRRMAQGIPVASRRNRDPAAQANPRTGNPATVAASRVRRLHEAGVIAPAWWVPEKGIRREGTCAVGAIDYVTCILWDLTATGRAMAAGEVERAATTQAADAATARCWISGRPVRGAVEPAMHGGLDAAVARMTPADPATRRAFVAARPHLAARAGMPHDLDGLAVVGLALTCGTLVAEGEALRCVDGAAAPVDRAAVAR